MYYKCHITIEPVFEEKLEVVKDIAANHKFKVAELLMQKRKEDTAERSKYDTFMTGHEKDHCDDLMIRMVNCIKELKDKGFKVWRYKIEHITMDSRIWDKFGLLH